jgi:hypothetical protein
MSIRKLSHISIGVGLAFALILATSLGPLTVRTGGIEVSFGRQTDGYAIRLSAKGCADNCQPLAVAWQLHHSESADPTRLRASLQRLS